MNERVLQLGPERNLVGVWTEPQRQALPLAVLMLNAGVIYRIGAHRTSVKLARHLASQGFGCARFDLCGVGDSRAPRGAADFRTQAVLDIRQVMDAIQASEGTRQFVLVGICSGAAHAQATALVDPRVRGVFLIDCFVYPSWKGRLHFLARMRRAYGWLGLMSRLLSHGRTKLARQGGPAPDAGLADEGPRRTREQYAQDMRELARRQVQVSLLFTGSILELYGYAGQLRDSFAGEPWLDHVRCLFEPEIDHTVTLRAAQRALLERVGTWVRGVQESIAA
jgi:alpha-beta hydrolase superfamily lysophospholipase